MVAKFKFVRIEEVNKLVEEVEKLPFEIYVETENIYINAKSLLALYTLISKEIILVAPDNAEPTLFTKLLKRLKKA